MFKIFGQTEKKFDKFETLSIGHTPVVSCILTLLFKVTNDPGWLNNRYVALNVVIAKNPKIYENQKYLRCFYYPIAVLLVVIVHISKLCMAEK